MTRAYDNAADARFPSGRRNLIINGNFNVAQRGTSSSTNGYTSLDRWTWSGTGTLSQETFTIGQTDVPGEPEKYLKLDVTTGAANTRVEQRIEDVRTTANQTFTISFYAKGTNPAGGEVDILCEQRFGSGGSNEVLLTTQAFVLTSSWTKYELTFTAPSISGKTVGAGNYFRVRIQQPGDDSGTDAWELNLSKFQLELGNIATPFEHRSYGEELALCQRYYYNHTPLSTTSVYAPIMMASLYGSTNAYGIIYFPVTMRAKPTLDFTNDNDNNYRIFCDGTNNTFRGSEFAIQRMGLNSAALAISGISFTIGYSAWVETWQASGTAGLARFNAEL